MTDLLALVLETHVGFANRLLAKADLPPADEIEAVPQMPTAGGRCVDLEVLGRSARSVVARLWSENKTGADYQLDQVPDYARDLAAFPKPHQLITIVYKPSEVPVDDLHPDEPRWRGFTWRDVALMAWEAGDEACPEVERAVWDEAALRPDAPASQRILLELLTYLEEEHGVVLDPLGYENVAALAYIADTGDILDELLRCAGEFAHVDTDVAQGQLQAPGRASTRPGPGPSSSVARRSCTPPMNDEWSDDRIGEPALGAGYSLPEANAGELLSEVTRTWRTAVHAEGFSISVEDAFVRVWRTKYLAELLPAGLTLDTQAREVARWLDESLALLGQHNPGLIS